MKRLMCAPVPRGGSALAWLPRWAWAVLALVWLLCAPGLAQAAKPYGVVTVDLRPDVGDVPTQICVVSQGKGPRTRARLSELLLGEVEEGEGGADTREAAGLGGELVVDPAAWGGAADDQVCEAGGACLPRVELPFAGAAADELWVACTSDSLISDRTPRDPRILFMMLEHLEGSPPLLESVKLTGGVVTVGVQADLSRIVVTARSLGGHYDAHGRAYRAEEGSDSSELVVLPLAPRCHGVEVELPGVRLRESDRDRLVLRANDASLDPDTCVGPLRGTSRMRVELPRAEGFGHLEVELPPTADERPTATRFAGDWDKAWPAGKLRLSPHRIAFVWSPPACVWERGTCPGATLEGGIACSATALDDGSCQYLCPGEEGDDEWVELSTPLAVSFEKSAPDQRWTEILQRPGQTLGAYVDSDQLYLSADISDWRTEIPGSRISHVELLDPDGGVRRYAVGDGELRLSAREQSKRDSLQILAPGASCDPLRYRLIGDRRYREGSAAVSEGAVEFGDVHRTARLLTFNLTLVQGGGLAMAPQRPEEVSSPVYFMGLGQLAANFRPRNPRFSRLSYEARIGGTIGQWGFYGPGSIGEEERRVSEKVAWARILFEPALIVDVVPPLALGVGVGVGGSWPINNRDEPNTGRYTFIVSPSAQARISIRRWISIVAEGRAIFLERTLVATDIIGDSVRYASYPNVSLIGLYGLMFSF
ncbi:hypothetical protein G6O69_31040 [Pseudenhygromyxa sp. WMMC2535]|uniref:hypothetical protein n=1 Tax=Pseudenhygromyxa sp. WMMC2535 TaxID=2712867 RepID=UPI0015950446|nr:hypothetical protein [Pseudenhygromyxa sp. WMMC2535]NVB42301.1 hypothetical protein [Pseudenhygromyxa sp. WMMC2535]